MTNVLKSKIAKAGLGLLVAGSLLASSASVVGAMTLAEAQALVAALGLTGTQASMVLALATPATTTGGTCYQFTTLLKVGSTGEDVRQLQMVLNATPGAALAVAPGAAGSVGHESSYFGPATGSAVMKYQASKGIAGTVPQVGPATRAALNAQCTTTTPPVTPPTTGPVAAMLATDNPGSGTLVANQATADLAHFAFTGTGVVTNVTLQRVGVSGDATLSNVYLFDGATRLTDAASVSNNGMITFNNPAGLFTVTGSKTIKVKSDILTGTSGQTVGVKLVSFMTAGSTTAMTSGVTGNIHSIATATLATVTLSGTITPSGATINPAAGVTLWQGTLNIGERDVWMKRFALRQTGSAPASAFQNFKLYVGGVQVATAAALDSMGYVTFDLSNTPVNLVSGARVVRVDADVVSGASRTVKFSLRQAADVDFVDSSFMVNVTPATTGTALPWVGTENTISGASGGTLTIEKDTSSPSTNVTLNGSDVNLGTFKLTAYGEPIKVENLRATFATSDASVDSLRNGRILVNGVQYGSSATLLEDSTGIFYTQYTLNYTVMPGTPVMVEVHADAYDNDGTNDLNANDTIQAKIAAGSSNAVRVDSLGSFSAPGAAVSANTLTVKSATVTLTKTPSYGDQTVVLPYNLAKIGSWNLTGSSVEDVLLTTLSFAVDEESGTEFDELDLTNMYVVVKNSAGTVVAQPAPLGIVAATSNNFSINYNLAKNANVSFELYANLSDDGLDSTIDTGDSFKTTLTVTGTSMVSGQAVTGGATIGQIIAAGAASITATTDASSPTAAIVYDNQTVTTAAFRFAAVTSAYDVTDLTVTIADATAVTNVMLYDGTTLVASQPGAASVVFSGLNWTVPANTNKILTVQLQLGTVGIGAGTSGADLTTAIGVFTARSVATGVSADGTGTPTGAVTYVYAAIPTITKVALTDADLMNGDNTLMRFTITGNGGPIEWDWLFFEVSKDEDTVLTNATLWDVTGGSNTEVAGTDTITTLGDTDVAGSVKFIPTAVQSVSGTKTYELRATASAVVIDVASVVTRMAQDATYNAPDQVTDVDADTDVTIIWSDLSASGHATTTDDWSGDYGVKNLPISQTIHS